MPGCIIPGCSTNRNNKAYDGIGLFKLPNCAGDFYQNWKYRIVSVLKQYLSMDGDGWEQRIKSGKVWMCERHYKPEDFERTKTGKKTLRLEALPTENLPEKNRYHPKDEKRDVPPSVDSSDRKDASSGVIVRSTEDNSRPVDQKPAMSVQLDRRSTPSAAYSYKTSDVAIFYPEKLSPGVSDVRPWSVLPTYIPKPNSELEQAQQAQLQPQFIRASPFVPIHVPPGIQKMTDGSASSAPHPYAYYPVMPCSSDGYPVQFLYYPVKIPVNPVRPMMADEIRKGDKRTAGTATISSVEASIDPKPPESNQPRINLDSMQAVTTTVEERRALQTNESAVLTSVNNSTNLVVSPQSTAFSPNNKTLAEEMSARSAMQPRPSSLARKRRQLLGIVDRVTEAATKKQNSNCTSDLSCDTTSSNDSIIPRADTNSAITVNSSASSCGVPSGSKLPSRVDSAMRNVRTSNDFCKTKNEVAGEDQDLSSIDDIRSILKSPMEAVDGMFSFSPWSSPSSRRLSITSANNVSTMTLNSVPSTRASNAHLKFCKTINTGVMESSSCTSSSSSSFSPSGKCPSSTSAMLLSLASTALDTTRAKTDGKHSPPPGLITPCSTNIPCAFNPLCDGTLSTASMSLYTMSATSMASLTQPSPSTFSNAATSYAEKQKLIQENTAPTLLLAKEQVSNAASERKTPEPTPYEQKLIDVVSSSIDSLTTMRSLPEGLSCGRQIVGNNPCNTLALRPRRKDHDDRSLTRASKSPYSDLCPADSESEEYHALIEMSILQSAYNPPLHCNPAVSNTNFPCITSPPVNTSLRRDVQVSSCIATVRSRRESRTIQELSPSRKHGLASPLRRSVEDFTSLFNDINSDEESSFFHDNHRSRTPCSEMGERNALYSPFSSMDCIGEDWEDGLSTDEPRVVVEDVRSDDSLKGVILDLSEKPEYKHIDFQLHASRRRTKRKAFGEDNSSQVIRSKRTKITGVHEKP